MDQELKIFGEINLKIEVKNGQNSSDKQSHRSETAIGY